MDLSKIVIKPDELPSATQYAEPLTEIINELIKTNWRDGYADVAWKFMMRGLMDRHNLSFPTANIVIVVNMPKIAEAYRAVGWEVDYGPNVNDFAFVTFKKPDKKAEKEEKIGLVTGIPCVWCRAILRNGEPVERNYLTGNQPLHRECRDESDEDWKNSPG